VKANLSDKTVETAKVEPAWYAAICLAGEAGLRAGEVRALRWGDDVDMTARTLTVNQQIRHLRWMGHKRNDETML
jgi:integrase